MMIRMMIRTNKPRLMYTSQPLPVVVCVPAA